MCAKHTAIGPCMLVCLKCPSKLCSPPVQASWGLLTQLPRGPKATWLCRKNPLSCWELAYCKAQHTTAPTRSHGISKTGYWFITLTSVIARRDSPVSKFTKKNACLKASDWPTGLHINQKARMTFTLSQTQPLNHYIIHGEGKLIND